MTNAANFNDYSGDGVFGRDRLQVLDPYRVNASFVAYSTYWPTKRILNAEICLVSLVK
jgi:hypothetical protein